MGKHYKNLTVARVNLLLSTTISGFRRTALKPETTNLSCYYLFISELCDDGIKMIREPQFNIKIGL